MKIIIVSIFLLITSYEVFAQWPGYFYAFELKDEDGNYIDSLNRNYEMLPVKNDSVDEMMLSIEICEDNKTWRYYEGGFAYKGLDKINKLEITMSGDSGEKMIIEFPPSSLGEDRQYENLYLGTIQFKPGTYIVKLPKFEKREGLKEIKICPVSYMDYSFLDISEYQK